MIWQNLWALGGASLLVLPVLIHLLSRKRAVLQRFPTLRFLTVTRLLPTRSPNLSDIPLLLVRLSIVAAAVLALAQPLWVSASRRQSLNLSLARVIVVDTSRSMFSTVTNGKLAVDSARALATSLATEASTSVVFETASPSRVLAGAAAWLATQGGRGDVVVLSDFQAGSVDSADFASVPRRYGVRAVRLGKMPASNSGIILHTARTNVTAVADSGRIRAEWTLANGASSSVLVLLSSAADRATVDASRDAARIVTSPGATDSAKLVAIAFPGAAELSSLLKSAKAPTVAWMAQAMLNVRANTLLAESAAGALVKDTLIAAPFAVVARNASGAPVVLAAEAVINGSSRLLFVQRASAAALSSAALIAAVNASVAVASDLPESETLALSDEALRKLERVSQDVGAGMPDGEQRASARSGLSDGRWLWVLVLVLLGVETGMRRRAHNTDVLQAA